MLSLWQNNFIFEKSAYFPVVPDNSQDFWGHDSSHSVVFYEIILWHHRSRFIFYMLQIMPTGAPLNKKTKKNTQNYIIL